MKLNPMRNQFYIYEILEAIDGHFVKDETGKDRDCPFNEALKQVYSEFQDLKRNWKYPFEEGETYYTIEYSNLHEKYVVEESCWDDQSEVLHDENPDRQYFKTRESAIGEARELQ